MDTQNWGVVPSLCNELLNTKSTADSSQNIVEVAIEISHTHDFNFIGMYDNFVINLPLHNTLDFWISV